MRFSIRPTTADDWVQVRALRLEMLADAPNAFAESLETARLHDERHWRASAARGSTDATIRLAAITDDGEWIGTMGGFIPDDGTTPLLVGVYVAPAYRGDSFGVMDALLSRVEQWMHARSDSISLHVHEDNPRAQAAYRKRGYAPTGRTIPYVLDERQNELEMSKELPRTDIR